MQLYEIVTLVNELLPTTPDTQGNQVSPTSIVGTSSRGAGRKYSAVTIGKVEESGQGATPEISAREMLLRNQPELLLQFGTDLFPMLVQVRDYWTYHLFILVFLASTFLVETNVFSLLWE